MDRIKRPPVFFIAGPYAAASDWQKKQNIYNAERAAAMLWTHKIPTICPHLNTAHFSGLMPEEFFYEGYLHIMRRCDALFLTPYWSTSTGTIQEAGEALDLGIPIFDELMYALDAIARGFETARTATGLAEIIRAAQGKIAGLEPQPGAM